jgi:Sulfotransferase domain
LATATAASMIFITSVPKAGTHLLASVVQDLLGVYPTSVKKAGVMHASAYAQYTGHACLVGHFRDHQLRGNDGLLELFRSRKVIVLVRDPRDVCKSMVHYLLQQQEPRQRQLADLIRELPFKEQVMCVAGGLSLVDRTFEVLRLEEHCDGFVGVQSLVPTVCVLRYEDFFTDVAAKQLASFLGFNRRLVKQAVSKALGGRSQTKRKGTPYEWLHAFDDELKLYFDVEHGEALRKLGYPLSTEVDATTRKVGQLSAPPKPASAVSRDEQPSKADDKVGIVAVRQRAPLQALEGAPSLGAADLQRLRAVEQENARLKRLLANAMLEIDSLREMLVQPSDLPMR